MEKNWGDTPSATLNRCVMQIHSQQFPVQKKRKGKGFERLTKPYTDV